MLFGQSVVANFIATPGGTLLACNGAFAELFGFATVESACATHVRMLDPGFPARVELLVSLGPDGRLQRREARMRCIDGRAVHVRADWTGRFDASGQLAEIWGTIADTTHEHSLEKERERTRRLDTMGALAAGAAHDFNNVLTSVLGYGRLALERAQQGGDATRELREAMRAAEHGSDIARQLLALGRGRAPRTSALVLDTVLSGSEPALRALLPASMSLAITPSAPAAAVAIETSEITRIASNLVLNARDASAPTGTITLSTRRVEYPAGFRNDGFTAPAGTYVCLEVRDEGCGMDAETRARSFEPFFTTKPEGRGTGLGLATVAGLARLRGGFVMLVSALGQGTTVTVCLPVHSEHAADASPARAPFAGRPA